jgi:hypothetical protein
MEGTEKQGSCVVQALDTSGKSDDGTSSEGLVVFVVFGEGGGFSPDEVVELVVLVVYQVETDSLVEQGLLSAMGKEGDDAFVVG